VEIFRCLHRIARADRGQERQKQREKQRKVPYVTEREGKVDSEMEISGVISYGIAPVISVKTFLPETSMMAGTDMEEEDLYTRQKLLQRQLQSVDIQEEYIKAEQKNLKRELLRAQEEVKRIQSVPLVVGQFIEMVDQNNGIVGSTTGSNYYVRILNTINRELLKPSSSVALHRHSNALVDTLPPEADSSISLLSQSEKPDVTYSVCLSLSQSYTFVQLESRKLLRK
jgi:26S proteasome regulatory subunit T3